MSGPPTQIQKFSLIDYLESDPNATINSPRSFQACGIEGVAPADLIYKPIEAFAEKGLEPRLVKLRYDFFEAKRKDLLAACRKAREVIIEEENKERLKNTHMGHMTLAEMSRSKGVSTGVLSALQSDCVKQERNKMQHAQHLQLQWLQNCLAHQLHTSKMLEKADSFLAQEEADNEQGQKEHNEMVRRKNEERRQREEDKMNELLAQQKLERQIAKEEFARQQEELEHQKKLAEQKRKELHARSVAEQEHKAQLEREKDEKRRQAWLTQQRKVEEMKANDDRRKAIRNMQKQQHHQMMLERKKFKEDRVKLSMQNLDNKLADKMAHFTEKQNMEQAREDRLENLRLLKQEENAKRGLHTQMKRKSIADEAFRKLEERRNNILEHQVEVEHRLMLHEMKKERYLEFKSELDGLKERNKSINVIRQRRREDQKRENQAALCRKKDDKSEMLLHERKFLWGLRRTTGLEISRAKEEIKNLMTSMKVKSEYDSKKVEQNMRKIFRRNIFNTDFQTVQSLPDLGLTVNTTAGGPSLGISGDTSLAGIQ